MEIWKPNSYSVTDLSTKREYRFVDQFSLKGLLYKIFADLDESGVEEAVDALCAKLNRGDYYGDEEDFLNIAVSREDPNESALVFNEKGEEVDYDAAASTMDEDICKEMKHIGGYYTPQDFFDEYAKRHEAKHHESWLPYVGGAW